jgi:hypothetical protein
VTGVVKEFATSSDDDVTDPEEPIEQGYARWIAQLPDERREILSINDGDLQGEFVGASAKFAWWYERFAAAEEAYERAQTDTKAERARARLAILLEVPAGAKRPAKDVLDASVEIHPTVVAAVDAEHAARREYRRWQGDVEALRHRRDYLVQLGARTRNEWLRDPAIREQPTNNKQQRDPTP